MSSRPAISPHDATVVIRSRATFGPDDGQHGTLRQRSRRLAQRGRAAADRQRAVHRRPDRAGPGLWRVRARAGQPCGDPRGRSRGGARDAGRARRLWRPGCGGRRARRDPASRGVSRPRRQADVCGRDAGAGGRTASAMSASRSRSWWRRRWLRRRTLPRRCASITTSCRTLPNIERALADDATPIHAARPGNVALDWTDGNAATVDRAFATAAHVERVRLDDTRLAPVSMEPRAASVRSIPPPAATR